MYIKIKPKKWELGEFHFLSTREEDAQNTVVYFRLICSAVSLQQIDRETATFDASEVPENKTSIM